MHHRLRFLVGPALGGLLFLASWMVATEESGGQSKQVPPPPLRPRTTTQEPPLLGPAEKESVQKRASEINLKPFIFQNSDGLTFFPQGQRLVPIAQARAGIPRTVITPYIIGGRRARADEFPHCVALGSKTGGFSCCTGTLIGPNVIVTAAHCPVLGCSPSHVFFGLDSNKANETPNNIYEVANVIYHKNYQENQPGFDIALIILKNSVTIPGVTPCPIAAAADFVGAGRLRAAGFGVTENDEKNILFTVDVSIADSSCAQGSVAQFPCAQGKEIVTISAGKDTCFGDSGGPAYIVKSDGSLVLAGATSRGSKPCGTVGIYTRVDVYVPWIVNVASEFGGILPAGFPNGTTQPANPCLPTGNTPALMVRDRLSQWKTEFPELYNRLFPGQ